MFLGLDFLSMLVILGFGAVILYPMGFLHRRKVFHLSLLQILYLIVIPGFLFVLGNSYMRQIILRPEVEKVFLPDGLITNVILLSMLFVYGGLSIHAVTKMLSEVLKKRDRENDFAKINRFFHLNFSHNLIYGGIILILFGFMLLEFNHVPQGEVETVWWLVIKGLVLGTSLVGGMFFYTRSRTSYVGRWADLRAVFFMLWLMFIVLIYGIRRFNPVWQEYDFLIPGIVGFGVVAFLNAVLVFRRLKNGRIVSRLRVGRLFNKNKK